MSQGFSFASVVLSYFLVAGGMFTAMLVAGELRLGGEYVGYAFLAVGAFIGGFIAARASRGSTIVEPAIGTVAVVGTIVGLAATTQLGQLIWAVAPDQTMKFVGSVSLCGVVGALLGAVLSERLLGEATRSSVPWVLYTALCTFGASLLATLFASLLLISGRTAQLEGAEVILIGMAAGCLIAGLAIGASARVRPLFASLIGGGLGVAGFFLLISRATPQDRDTTTGMIVLAVGGAIVTLVGTTVGWVGFGRKSAVAVSPAGRLAR
jgi:hypothetical protein